MQFNNEARIHPNIIRQILLLAVILLMGIILYREMTFMVAAVLGAIALYTLMRKLMFTMVHKWKMKKWAAAWILIIASLAIIVIPFAVVIDILIKKLIPYLQDTTRITDTLEQVEKYIHNRFGVDILSQENQAKIPGVLAQFGTKVVGSTLTMVANVFIMYFILWFMLVKSAEMEAGLRRNLPFKFTNNNILLNEIKGMVVSNAVGIPVLGLIQGILASVGYYIFGVDQPVLWGIITGLASAIPFVGTTLVWLPISIIAFAKGNVGAGWGLLIWGAVVIGSSDNVIRFVLQKYMADVHPLITVFGVIVGLNLFGFMGLIFGPLLFSLFLLLIRIYRDEFSKESHPPPVEGDASSSVMH
jgi:predicted PurR-regulated permease PerM